MTAVPVWAEVIVSLLLLVSGGVSLVAAFGLVRARDFFQRMHPPALVSTGGAWCVSLGSIVYFSMAAGALTVHALVINVLVAITAPVTTTLLARAALFRRRQRGDDVPPALGDGTIEAS